MKKSLLCSFLLLCLFASAQTPDHVKFEYDAAGNQVLRELIDITPGRYKNDSIKAPEELAEGDWKESDLYADIKYYPNPVKEELHVKWTNKAGNYVTSVELYTLNGQLMKQLKNLKNTDNANVAFHAYPEGMYTLVLVYANGERKTLKIVKR